MLLTPAAIALKSSTIEVFSAASTGAWNQSVRSYSSASETIGACGGTGWMPRNSTAHSGWLTRCRRQPPTVIPGSADSSSHRLGDRRGGDQPRQRGGGAEQGVAVEGPGEGQRHAAEDRAASGRNPSADAAPPSNPAGQ